MDAMDPFSALGVGPDASEAELTAAYRRLARRWHPDQAWGDGQRMAQVNEAYARAQAELRSAARRRRAAAVARAIRPRPAPGSWLPEALRRRLGTELAAALSEHEPVRLVARAGRTGAGPARLALTDRRLLWVCEDAVGARVDWVRLGVVAHVEQRRGRLGRRAVLRLRTSTGRRVAFGDLAPRAAAALAAALAEGVATP